MLPSTCPAANYTLLTGHVLDQLRALTAQSVQMVITSPPYFGLRDYKVGEQLWGGAPDCVHAWEILDGAGCSCGAWKGELGHEPTVDLFVEHMTAVFKEVHRVLRDDGVVFLNIGDSFHSGRKNKEQSIKHKDLSGVPWALAFALRHDGWYIRGDNIWSKAGGNCPRCHYRIEKGSGLPEAVTDRFVRSHEHFFLLTKRPTYYFDHEGAKESGAHANRRDVIHMPAAQFRGAHFATMPIELARIAVRAGTSAHGACAKCNAPWERIVERGQTLGDLKLASGSTLSGDYNGHGTKDYADTAIQNPSDVKRRILESMRERITTGWAPTCACETTDVVPCVVLDPFSGAGTSGVATIELGRRYIGVDVDQKCNDEIAEPRLKAAVYTAVPTITPLPATSAVYCGKAELILQQLPASIARMVLTDPPYNTSRKNNFHTMGRRGIDFEWDGDFDQEEWLRHADRVLMPGGSLVIWNDWKVLGLVAHVLMDMGYDVKRNMTLLKSNPMPRNTTRSAVQRTEIGLWAVKPGATWVFNKRGASYEDFVFEYPVPRASNGRPRHDTKKPDGLWSEIIEILTNPGELVIDPFCGGGTLAYAAEKLGRAHISIDESTQWTAETTLRWDEAQKQEV